MKMEFGIKGKVNMNPLKLPLDLPLWMNSFLTTLIVVAQITALLYSAFDICQEVFSLAGTLHRKSVSLAGTLHRKSF